jgi:predicted RecB family nuclease
MSQLPIWESIPARRASVRALSKSRVMAGLQCRKRLYLEAYHYDEKDSMDPGRRAILDAGRHVGQVARGRYPGGITAAEDPQLHDQAVRETAGALSPSGPSAIYEAAFTHAQIRARVDILARRSGDAWDLIEVKSSSGFKEEYLHDIAIQLHVAEGSGVRIGRAMLLHVNNQYVWPGGDYDLGALFTELDLTADARAAIPGLLECVEAMRATLQSTEIPDIAVGPHCRKPYICSFYDYCHQGTAKHHVADLPRLSPKIYRALLGADIVDIRDIPEEFDGLSDLQWRVRNCVVKGEPYSHPDLKTVLDAVRYPIHFLDFETCNPAVPIIPGTRPFQQTPFQWSDHVLDAGGSLHHRSYLHTDRTDPRRRLTEELLDALDGEGSIMVYSEFEARVIRALAEALPSLADRLLPLVERRMVDLHHIIHAHYYHPDFHGSFSIKDVVPVLVAGLDYSDLDIREGSQAAGAFAVMTDPKTPAADRRKFREGLLAYCRRDTEAMLRLFQTLKENS